MKTPQINFRSHALFLASTLSITLSISLATTLALETRLAAEEAPNFVIFYADDLGWADTSVRMMDDEPRSADNFYQTPSLERLSKQGVRFSNGYSPTPTCTGSRISIQFGKTSARLQYRNVFDVLAKKQRPQGWDDEVSKRIGLDKQGNPIKSRK